MARVRQSGPDSSLGLQVKVLEQSYGVASIITREGHLRRRVLDWYRRVQMFVLGKSYIEATSVEEVEVDDARAH